MNDIAKTEENQTSVTTIAQVIESAATNPNVDVDKMDRLLDMQERILNKQAEHAYAKAMKDCQQEMPSIVKDASNNQTNSTYALLETINKAITPVYTKHGFSLSFGTDKAELDNHIRITCDVMHEQGHSKHFYFDLPLDDSGIKGTTNKTKVHASGSTLSYGRRYLAMLIFNLTVGDDDDGNEAGGDTRSALEVENWWIDRMAAIRELIPSIYEIKTGIAVNDLESAVNAWMELTDDEKKIVWSPAPTKGGILTTQERTVIKSNEWYETRKNLYGEKAEQHGK